MIKTLIFDFGGVLINLDKEACVSRYKQLGVSNVDKLLDNYIQSGVFLQFEQGEISLAEFHDKVRQLSGHNISDKDIDDAFCAFLLDIPDKKMQKIKQLRSKYRIVMLSNTNELHFPMNSGKLVVGDYLISDYFDHCYLSFQMHLSKPDSRIFQALLENEKVLAEECLFLDDGPQNIAAAQKMGFNCFLVENGLWVDEIDELLQSLNK